MHRAKAIAFLILLGQSAVLAATDPLVLNKAGQGAGRGPGGPPHNTIEKSDSVNMERPAADSQLSRVTL